MRTKLGIFVDNDQFEISCKLSKRPLPLTHESLRRQNPNHELLGSQRVFQSQQVYNSPLGPQELTLAEANGRVPTGVKKIDI